MSLHEKLDSIEWSSNGFSSSSGNSTGEKQCSIFGNKCDDGDRVVKKLSRRRREFVVRFGLGGGDGGEFGRNGGGCVGESEGGVVEKVVG